MVRFVGGRRADEWGLTPQRGLSRGRMVLMRAQRRAARRRVLPCGRVGRVAVRAVSGPCGGGNRVGQRWRLGGERAGRVGTQPRADPWGGALRGALRGRGGAAGVAREGCRAVGPEKREREVGHGWRERGVGAAEARGGHVPALGRRRGWGEAGGAVVGRQGPRQARPGKRRAGGRRGGGGTPREQRRPGRDRARGGTRRAGAYARWARMGCSGCTGGGCGGGGGEEGLSLRLGGVPARGRGVVPSKVLPARVLDIDRTVHRKHRPRRAGRVAVARRAIHRYGRRGSGMSSVHEPHHTCSPTALGTAAPSPGAAAASRRSAAAALLTARSRAAFPGEARGGRVRRQRALRRGRRGRGRGGGCRGGRRRPCWLLLPWRGDAP
mmetsp:Transcript_12791/g.41812  ORF Transcript_12791/g.41812 Transcript_12791/m.41812 type:complete len:381 (-) Transcript_12791:1655-2797(-)|eukprot:scaffold15258_cov111-Isochrysis_galbana.AAC.4